MNEDDLNKITARKGYGIVSSGITGGIKGNIGAWASISKDRDSGEVNDLESNSGDGSLDSKKLQVGYSGKVRIRITFYRRRFADYGEECSRAVSEKALIDCLVYAGLIEGDSGKEIWLEDGGQKKVESNEEEKTVIELFYTDVNYEDPWIKGKSHAGH